MIRVRNPFLIVTHLLISLVGLSYAFHCNDLKTICIITLLQFAYAIVIFTTLGVSPLNFGVVFIVCLMLFNYGQTWLYAIDMKTTDLKGYVNVFDTFSDEIIIIALRNALAAVCISLLVFIALTSQKKAVADNQEKTPLKNHFPLSWGGWNFIYIVYWCVVLFSNVMRAVSVFVLGYVEGFTFDNNFFYTVNLYIIPMVVVDMKYRKAKGRRYIGGLIPLLINEAIVILFVANRGASLIRLIVVAVYYFRQKDRAEIKKSTLIWVGAAALAISFLLPFISATRTDLLQVNFWTFIAKNNPIVVFLSEFGGSLATSCYSVSAVKSGNGSNGMQMLFCILTILPGSGILFPNITTDLQFAEKLNHLFKIRGLGGSLTGEFYYNFGYFGLLMYGIVYTVFSKLTGKALKRDNGVYREILIYQAMFGMITWVRGSLYDVVNSMKIAIYFCIILWVLSSFRRKPIMM